MHCFMHVETLFELLSGLISSNGVNGSPVSETSPKGSGIQGTFALTYFEDGLIPAAFMVRSISLSRLYLALQ